MGQRPGLGLKVVGVAQRLSQRRNRKEPGCPQRKPWEPPVGETGPGEKHGQMMSAEVTLEAQMGVRLEKGSEDPLRRDQWPQAEGKWLQSVSAGSS